MGAGRRNLPRFDLSNLTISATFQSTSLCLRTIERSDQLRPGAVAANRRRLRVRLVVLGVGLVCGAGTQPSRRLVYSGGRPTATATPGGSPTTATAVFQNGLNGYSGATDTYLSRNEPTSNFGAWSSVSLRWNGSCEDFAGLLRFDVSSLPTNANVQAATLTLNVTGRTAATTLTVGVHQVLRAWRDLAATWNLADTGVAWTTAGCNGVGSDRVGTASASFVLNQASGPVTVDVTGLAQGWVTTPAGNRGLLLRPAAGGAVLSYDLASASHWDASLRPKLIITYTVPAGLAAREVEVKVEAEVEPHALAAVVVTKYYYLGSTRVAMQQNGTLYYLFGDHLGSTTLTYNPTTGATARQLYTPYGEPRWPDPSALPTDRKFTGQRSEAAGLGSLYDYGARFYSPYLNRWIQPDTIIPNPGDPQSLNRYSYTANNPVKYRDPSGHIPCYGDSPDECSWAGYKDQPAGARRHSLRGYARFLEKQVQKDGMTTLDAMTDLWGFASLYGKNAVTTSEDVSYTLVGSGGTLTLLGGFILKGKEFLGGARLNLPNFGDTGFNPNYRDGHNQPYHFWANVNTTAQGGNLGQGIGLVANVVHEMADPSETLKTPQERGTSWEDYFLSLKGLEMGQMLRSGALTVDQLDASQPQRTGRAGV